MTNIYTSRNDENNLKGIAFRGITRELLDELLEGCQVISHDYRYLYLNKAALRHSQKALDDLINHTMMECYPGIEKTKMFAILRQCLENRKPKQMENEFIFQDDSKRWYELRFEPVPEGVFILSIDITVRKLAEDKLRKTEDQLRHSQKMEAIGLLAAGLAHDFNNLLTIVNISSDLIIRNMSSSNPLHKRVEQIRKAGEKASALTSQLLAFSRQQVMEQRVINLNDVITDMRDMIKRLIREDIKIEHNLEPKLAPIKVDPVHMEQLLLNMVINARDAIGEKRGTISIETKNLELNSAFTDTHIEVQAGKYVLITISDTGKGMDEYTREHLFEPFYTTKEPGKGSGLGLATVYGIVKQNGGSIWAYSEPGQGTVFKIYLPVYKGKEKPKKLEYKTQAVNGNETILLVEDQTEVREITSIALQMFGYNILQAANSKQAVDICKKTPGKIDLLISDVIMPGTTGRKVVENILKVAPQIKVLYMSGYTDDAIIKQGILQKEIAFIQKPFTPESLAQKVRYVLDQ